MLTPKQEQELKRVFDESWARDAAEAKERRKETGAVEVELEGGADDPSADDRAFQEELATFTRSLAGVIYSQRGMAFDAVDGQGYGLAEFVIKDLGPSAIGVVTAAVTGWLAGRAGRKARLKFGDVEAEARTPEEVEQLLKSAADFQARVKEKDDK